jgi:hypothetical protein
MAQSKEYAAAIIVTAIATILCFAVSIPTFHKQHL